MMLILSWEILISEIFTISENHGSDEYYLGVQFRIKDLVMIFPFINIFTIYTPTG